MADIYLDVEPVINKQEGQGFAPKRPSIQHVIPNPMATEGKIQVFLPQAASASLLLYNLHGKAVKTIIQRQQMAGGRQQWSIPNENQHGLRLQPGIYIVQLQVDGRPADSKRFIVV